MGNQVRVFRKNPIAWWDKNVMRYLRHKYGKDKKTFLPLHSVYLALCEIESDFVDKPVYFFTQSVGEYAGLSREAAGKYINILLREGLISRYQTTEEGTKKFSSGSVVEILGLDNVNNADVKASEPLSGYPDVGMSRCRDTQATLKNISISKKIINNVNVNEDLKKTNSDQKNSPAAISDLLLQFGLKRTKPDSQPEETAVQNYLADELVEKLGDPKGLGCYRKIAAKVPQAVIFDVLASVKDVAQSGKIRQNRASLFVSIIKQYAKERQIDLGFKSKTIDE